MPAGSPISRPITIAITPSSTVAGNLASIFSSTLQSPKRELPSVPCRKMSPSQRPYCTWIGWSNPIIRSIAYTVYITTEHPRHLTHERVYGIAREEAHRQEYQYRQQEEGRYQQQHAADRCMLSYSSC